MKLTTTVVLSKIRFWQHVKIEIMKRDTGRETHTERERERERKRGRVITGVGIRWTQMLKIRKFTKKKVNEYTVLRNKSVP